MEKKRLFVGNLPNEINEEIIKNRFSKYGEILSIELKHRYSGVNENEILSTFAFVDIQSSENALTKCFKKLSKKKWLGKEITLEFAKESILSRLENERKANAISKTNSTLEKTNELLNKNQENDVNRLSYNKGSENISSSGKKNYKTSSSSVTETNSENKNNNILSKLEMFSDVWKDCDEFSAKDEIKPEKNDKRDHFVKYKPNECNDDSNNEKFYEKSKPKVLIHTEDKKDNEKQIHSKKLAILSDKKRLKSVEEMKKTIDQRKQTIKKALSSIDSGHVNKKIVFNDDDDDINDKKEKINGVNDMLSRKTTQLFNEDSDDNEHEHSFVIKQQYEGAKGKKLFELQSKFGNDSRFAMDEKFYESGEEDDHEKTSNENTEKEETVTDEVSKQLAILQSIVGNENVLTKQRKRQKNDKSVSSAPGVRFDPTIPEHEKFIVKPSSKAKDEEDDDDDEKPRKNKKLKTVQKEDLTEKSVPNVSKETFYELADGLKESFKSSQKSSFSFADMFKSASVTDDKERKNDNLELNNINPKKRNAPYNNYADNRFGGKFEDETEPSNLQTYEKKPEKTGGSLWDVNFFYKHNDPRFEEVTQFFSKENVETEVENFNETRQKLKKIVKKKFVNKIKKDRPFKKKIGGFGSRKPFKKRKFH